MARFRDREAAGAELAEELARLGPERPVILGLPRGGVVVAAPIARRLSAPLDVVIVRKLGVPSRPELGMGAVGEEGVLVVNHEVVLMAGITQDELAWVRAKEEEEAARRAERYRRRPPVPLNGATAILVDDGLATGYTARAAIESARRRGAGSVWLAAGVGAPETVAGLSREADRVVCLHQPRRMLAVGQWYDDFTQVSDDDVVELLSGDLSAG